MPIRILRVIEYKYDTIEHMQEDMSRWSIPANGLRDLGRLEIRSATAPLEVVFNIANLEGGRGLTEDR
jgi:hypothetical protein